MKTTERWERVEEIFHAALEREPAERAAFLAEACAGDSELLAEVQSLIAAHQQTDSAIDSPAYAVAAEMLADTQLRLLAGQQLGPYKIIAKLGAGGMGEVYRARDTRLERDVAIKVLLSAYAGDADRMRRFEQEARAAGALNHPNILAIYDVGNQDGLFFVVSELLEGESLRERLKRATLAGRKTIDYALQIARGLAAAHEKGIVHRDLKPENLFITKDGHVKILDFGLAKLMPRGIGVKARTEASAMSTVADTEPGVIVGTVGYMSPEQVRGESVDHRSDIFSFGAILYEMLSGNRAFRGNSAVETMNAILKDEPPELSQVSSNISAAIERVVQHCVEKSVEERFQSARDIAFAIEALSGVSGSSSERVAIASTRSKRRWLLPVIVLALVGLLGVSFFVGQRTNKTSPPAFRQLTFRKGTLWTARFAPDGQTIYYGAASEGKPSEIFITRPDNPESRPYGLADANILSFSSRGEMALLLHPRIWSLRIKGALAVVPIAGGSPRELLDDVEEADWSPDGKDLAVIHWVDGRCRLEFPIGNVLYEARPGGCLYDVRVSPKGDRIAFSDHPVWGDTVGELAVVDLSGNKQVLNRWTSVFGLAWSATGDEVWCSGSESGTNQELYATTLSGTRRLVATTAGMLKLQDVSRDGRVLITREEIRVQMMGFSPGEENERDLAWLDASVVRDLSADGRTVLFDEEGVGGGLDPNNPVTMYLRKMDGSPATRIGEGDPLALSPEGKWVLARNRYTSQLMLLPTGIGEAKPIASDPIQYSQGTWFSDGKRLLLIGKERDHAARSYIYDLDTNSSQPVTPEGVAGRWISPDGKMIIAGGAKMKRSLFPLAGGEPREIQGLEDGDRIIQWSADGGSIYVDRFGEVRSKVYRIDLATGQRELWKEIAPADLTGATYIWGIRMTPDAKAYAYSYFRQLSELYLVDGAK